MNEFFYESRGKERLKELRNEGESSQAFYRSGAPKLSLLRGLPKMIVTLLAVLGLLELLVR
jgi:hypothetical protein